MSVLEYMQPATSFHFASAFIAVRSNQLHRQDEVFADRYQSIVRGHSFTVYVTLSVPSHIHTCQKTQGPTCVDLWPRVSGQCKNNSAHTTCDEEGRNPVASRANHEASECILCREGGDALFPTDFRGGLVPFRIRTAAHRLIVNFPTSKR